MTPPDTLLFTANSPGEIAGWLGPLVHTARARWPQARVVLLLLPCTFASGAEARVASERIQVDEVIPASAYLSLLGRGGRRLGRTVLLHLGGDLMYSALLSWRWGFSAWSYLWGRRWWDPAFQGYFVKDARGLDWLRRRRLPVSKGHPVGDLVADAVATALARDRPLAPPPGGERLCFLPGSRAHEVQGMVPFYLEIAERLLRSRPELECQLLLSPFLERGQARALLEAPPMARLGGVPGRLEGDHVVSEGGARLRLIWEGHMAALEGARLALTIPGTKTAEAGCLGVPQLVLLPLNQPELLPYIGLIGLLDWVPGGRAWKGRILTRMAGRIDHVAQPNLLAGERVVPELTGILRAEEVALEAEKLLAEPERLAATSHRLRELYRPSLGASARIFDLLETPPCPTARSR